MKKHYKTIILVVIIIAVFVAGFFVKDLIDKQKRSNEVNDYKKGYYAGLVCQYSCPMSMQKIANKSEMLPDADCIKNCSTVFKQKYSSFSATKEELQKDNLLNDIDQLIKDCKKNTINQTALSFNNTAYFNCAVDNLNSLKTNYKYLG